MCTSLLWKKNVNVDYLFLRKKETAYRMLYLKRMDAFGPPDLVAYKHDQIILACSFQSI